MDRRNFLAIIPSLSAVPFIGKDIVKEKDKIILYNPTPKIIQSVPMDWDIRDLRAKLYLNGQEIAEAYVVHLEVNNHINEGGAADRVVRATEARFECVVTGPLNIF